MLKRFFENVIKPKNNFGGRFMVKSMNIGHEKLASWGRSFLNIRSTDTLLDLGCGGGRNIQYFLTKANKVYGIDYSRASVDIARILNDKDIKDGRCQIIEGDVKNIPFDEKTIDIVTAFETIYFWKDIEACFREIHRVLKDGGEFLIVNEGAYREHKNIKKWADMLNFEVYSPEYLTNILTSIGFACEYHLDNKSHLAFIAKKIL
ncbi:class I SAM-dependent methyltransferase [Anaerococcus lactolyticus]|uniref:Ubiquinone biosynthesis methyltransferase UbiE n=1 Tax=Anaerococcus lactolyticus S7-1-13 TaxID=1284686 RepID=A0A095YBT9_9FIRM|nr:class I SAM-dependent methyltransferase [Anaerococcus lactolyticus]KGF04077.1 ubiquinone biosynthesis methyltransferase UbiE [Anaerococcus lactolyticus S7-1-13]